MCWVRCVKINIILSIYWAGHINAHADKKILILNDSVNFLEPRQDAVHIHEDVSGRKKISDILVIPEHEFSNYTEYYNKNTDHAYWIKCTVDAQYKKNQKWVIEILDSRFDEVELYYFDASGNLITRTAGINQPFSLRTYGHKNFVLDIDFIPGKKNTFYLKLKSKFIGSFIFKIRSNYEFSTYAFNEYFLLGLYYGILLIILLYNLILYITLKEVLYLFYLLYVGVWAWYSLLDDGLGFQYIWSAHPWISTLGYYVSKPLLVVFFVAYSRAFLNTQNFNRKADTIIKIVASVYIAYELLSWLLPLNSTLSNNISWVLFCIPFFSTYVITYQVYKSGFKPARYFLAGHSLIVLSLIVRTWKLIAAFDLSADSATLSILIVYSLNIGRIFEIVVFSAAQGDRIKFLKLKEQEAQLKIIEQLKINEQLNQKVNRELEEKVAQRTADLMQKTEELRLANIKLAQQAEEINRWNQLLDKDNHNLKNKVKEAVAARVKFKDITYEEFLTIFPDDLACERYLEEIKWKNGYRCKRCNNTKYCNGSKKFSRRCTKCRYDESITAYTLLHKCKFQLTKAFYIITKVNIFEDKLNCNELARQLNMRKSTVWEFKKKVMLAKQADKNKTEETLDSLILSSL